MEISEGSFISDFGEYLRNASALHALHESTKRWPSDRAAEVHTRWLRREKRKNIQSFQAVAENTI